MTQSIKPFARQGHYTSFDNAAIDIIMPNLTGNEWKVLSFIVRKTVGWHKDMDGISYSQFVSGTGVKSNTTIQKALNGLLKKRLIEQGETGNKTDPYFYRLNKSYAIDAGCVTETVKRPVTFSIKRPVTETVNTKETNKNKLEKEIIAPYGAPPPPLSNNGNQTHSGIPTQLNGSAAPPKKQPSAHALLMAAYQDMLGYKIPNGAKEGSGAKKILAAGYTVDQVRGCYEKMKRDWWKDKHLPLVSVYEQLGQYCKNGNSSIYDNLDVEAENERMNAHLPPL